MLLKNQIDLFRNNFKTLRRPQNVALPVMGGDDGTDEAYEFKNLILPGQDIATTIHQSDPAGNMLPCHLRGWQLDAGDGYGNTIEFILRNFSG